MTVKIEFMYIFYYSRLSVPEMLSVTNKGQQLYICLKKCATALRSNTDQIVDIILSV